jgi:hypothetical protein
MGADKKKSQCGAKRSYIAPGMTRIEGKHRKRSGNVIDIEIIGFYFMPDFFWFPHTQWHVTFPNFRKWMQIRPIVI